MTTRTTPNSASIEDKSCEVWWLHQDGALGMSPAKRRSLADRVQEWAAYHRLRKITFLNDGNLTNIHGQFADGRPLAGNARVLGAGFMLELLTFIDKYKLKALHVELLP